MDLNNLEAIKKLDKSNVRDSISGFTEQLGQTWEEIEKLNTPQGYENIKNILVVAMGGSTYGARIIKEFYFDLLNVPFDVTSDYRVPNYISEDSLVIASSYSGNTEETVTSLELAYRRGAKILGLTCQKGSNLDNFCRSNNIPCFLLNPKFNPTGQPRTGSGYMILGTIGWLVKLGLVTLSKTQIQNMITLLKNNLESLKVEIKAENNPAKKLALECFNKNVVLIGAEFLGGILYPIRNPIHETGKNFATFFPIPDLNHHLLEGLANPSSNKESFIYVFFESKFYSDSIKKRMELTKDVIKKNGLVVCEIHLQAEEKFEQVFEGIQLGHFTSFYLALLNGADPSTIPWVTYFQDTFRRSRS